MVLANIRFPLVPFRTIAAEERQHDHHDAQANGRELPDGQLVDAGNHVVRDGDADGTDDHRAQRDGDGQDAQAKQLLRAALGEGITIGQFMLAFSLTNHILCQFVHLKTSSLYKLE